MSSDSVDSASYTTACQDDIDNEHMEEQSSSSVPTTSTQDENRGMLAFGCQHYRRRCKLVTPCCNEVFWCRHCHNYERDETEKDGKKKHILDRKALKEVICALCDTRQTIGTSCIACGVKFGAYSCLTCNFFDDDTSRRQFHCDDCGLCRVGGKENFFHCKTCNACYATNMRTSHVCVENAMKQNCPVCLDFLFDSIRAIHVMPCGHTIHQECLQSMAEQHMFKCPMCSKSYFNQTHMQEVWRHLDQEILQVPMPNEYRDLRVGILCNDCGHGSKVPFHILGHKCDRCSGYNTRRV